MIDNLFGTSTKVQTYDVSIDEMKIFPDDVISLETKTSIHDFGMYGSIQIKDIYDFNNAGLVTFNGDNNIIIKLKDFAGSTSQRTYKILSMDVVKSPKGEKAYTFNFVDLITFKLSSSFISKSFNGTVSDAFESFLTELNIDDLLEADKLTKDITTSTESKQFVVPQNTSVLEFFEAELNKENLRLYQNRYGLFIKEIILADMKQAQIDDKNVIYSDAASNSDYLFKIFELKETKNDIGTAQKNTTFRFGQDKLIVSETLNLSEEMKTLKLNNSDTATLQHTVGTEYSTQLIKGTKIQAFNVFDDFISNNSMLIVVPGVLETNVGTVVELKIKGSMSTKAGIDSGDAMLSGKYFISGLSDRIVGDKLLQRITLNRVDWSV